MSLYDWFSQQLRENPEAMQKELERIEGGATDSLLGRQWLQQLETLDEEERQRAHMLIDVYRMVAPMVTKLAELERRVRELEDEPPRS